MNPNNLMDDDRQAIMEFHDPDWRDHFFSWQAAWDWYMEYGGLDKAIGEYER